MKIGLVYSFPLAGSVLHNTPEDDMLCYFPVEGWNDKKPMREPRFVQPWYKFTDILHEGAEEESHVSQSTVEFAQPLPRA